MHLELIVETVYWKPNAMRAECINHLRPETGVLQSVEQSKQHQASFLNRYGFCLHCGSSRFESRVEHDFSGQIFMVFPGRVMAVAVIGCCLSHG
jgi:hypothetical protein